MRGYDDLPVEHLQLPDFETVYSKESAIALLEYWVSQAYVNKEWQVN